MSCFIGQECDLHPRMERVYHPPIITYNKAQEQSNLAATDAPPAALLDAWMCSLPTYTIRQHNSMPFREITVGKMIRRWAMLLAEGMARPHIHNDTATSPHRVVNDPTSITSWAWFPSASDTVNSSTCGWFVADLCQHPGSFQQLTLQESNAVQRFVEAQIHSQAGLLWLVSQSVRMVMKYFLDDCGRAAVQQMKKQQVVVVANSVAQRRSGRTIAMQIRRGDACERWETIAGNTISSSGRPCYATNLYMDAAQQMQRIYGADKIILVTDSPLVVEDVAQAANILNMSLTYISGERSIFGVENQRPSVLVTNETTRVHPTFIENRNDLTAKDVQFITTSLIAELELLQEADCFIGTSISWVSRLAFLLMTGSQRKVPPFSFLDQPFRYAQWDSNLTRHCRPRSCACETALNRSL